MNIEDIAPMAMTRRLKNLAWVLHASVAFKIILLIAKLYMPNV